MAAPAALPVPETPSAPATVTRPAAAPRRTRQVRKAPKAATAATVRKVRTAATRKPVRKTARKSAKPQPKQHPRYVKVRELDPFAMCGPGTSVARLFRVDERVNGSAATHLVFYDRHGWYCEHGKTCPAVHDARKQR